MWWRLRFSMIMLAPCFPNYAKIVIRSHSTVIDEHFKGIEVMQTVIQ